MVDMKGGYLNGYISRDKMPEVLGGDDEEHCDKPLRGTPE